MGVFNGWSLDSPEFDFVGCGDQESERLDTWMHADSHTSNIYRPASTCKHTNAQLNASALRLAPRICKYVHSCEALPNMWRKAWANCAITCDSCPQKWKRTSVLRQDYGMCLPPPTGSLLAPFGLFFIFFSFWIPRWLTSLIQALWRVAAHDGEWATN